VLDLKSNQIGDLGVKCLADALRKNRSLNTVDLSINAITNDGAKYLAAALSENTSLTVLVLIHNPIDDPFVKRKLFGLHEVSKSSFLNGFHLLYILTSVSTAELSKKISTGIHKAPAATTSKRCQ
jgi:hypothetical protein